MLVTQTAIYLMLEAIAVNAFGLISFKADGNGYDCRRQYLKVIRLQSWMLFMSHDCALMGGDEAEHIRACSAQNGCY